MTGKTQIHDSRHDSEALRLLLDVLADSAQMPSPLREDIASLRDAIRKNDQESEISNHAVREFLLHKLRGNHP